MSDLAAYDRLCAHARETALLVSIQGLLEWDERTMMPPQGGAYRAEQIAYLAGQVHRRQTDPQVGDWLAELAAGPLADDPSSDAGTVLRRLRRTYDKKTRLPSTLVEELSRTSVLGQQAWVEARREDSYALFLPLLERTLELKRQEAAALGYQETPYDPLLDDYEPEARTAEVAQTLASLRNALTPLLDRILGSSRGPSDEPLRRAFPVAAQEAIGRETAAAIGFEFAAGRLDVTAHPFCGGAGPCDVRITTRYNERDFGDAFFSILHEAGHGLYEQGLPAEQFGLPTGEAASLGIHESQSRMWENQVGRSRAFWRWRWPGVRQAFAATLADVDAEAFYGAVNVVRPSLIRVDADEITYNLHICIRFELERALIEGNLAPAELPEAWQESYQRLLGIQSSNDADGVLQDVHWSAGLFGYFPTYSLGNLYAAQFFGQAERDLGDLAGAIERGEFAELLTWLRTKIHAHGRRYDAGELVRRVTGRPLATDDWVRLMTEKYAELYQL